MMNQNFKIFALLAFIFLVGCTKDDSVEEEATDVNPVSRGCTEWSYNGNFTSNSPDGFGGFSAGLRSRVCGISETSTTITVNAIIEPTNGGIDVFNSNHFNGVEITYYGGERLVIGKNDFNNGGTIERTITANKADLDSYGLNNWSITLVYDFVYATATEETTDTTVQQLIDMGVSLSDIAQIHGFSLADIYGKKYLDGMITHLEQTNSGEILNGTVMAFQNHPQKLNWDDAMNMFPSSWESSSDGLWSIPMAYDFEYMTLSIIASTETHPSWIRPDGGYWLPGSSGGEFDAYGDAYYFYSGQGMWTETLKGTELNIRLVKNF
ncbi:hypothetical protein RBU60_13550 [Mesonia sp. MT50]|uniref:Lipoprotein n=1 Tax=Mesonia profundi TaxID=3070998 RepID=A0ABU1A4S4_9FLAO|nr:hypothetical protein [Mesonia profundi]MDQ7918599.1 hypothetical protein [Mesonia profundi]